MAFVPVCLAFMPMGWKLRTGKGRRSLPGSDLWQKGAFVTLSWLIRICDESFRLAKMV
jgi:hypothetical protein